jgi:hypothetical protein
MNRRLMAIMVVVCLTVAIITLEFADAFITTASTSGASSLRVNESLTRVQMREGRTVIALALENTSGRQQRASIRLQWIDPSDEVQRQHEIRENVRTGSSVVRIPLPLSRDPSDQEKLLWYRLRYRLNPDFSAEASSASNFAAIEGVISLSEITPDIFELRVIAADTPVAGKRYRAHVRAAHPISQRPVRGVNVSAELTFDKGKDDSFLAQNTTDANGYATLNFDLPRDLNTEDGKLEINADKGDFSQTAESDLRNPFDNNARLLLSTDKPLYQPGQTLRIRLLAFDLTRRAIRHAPVEFVIEDPENATQFRASAQTSRFGIASAEWPIPENTRLGEYRIRVSLEDDEANLSGESAYTVKISRYDLPNFAVQTKSDKPYYLPGQNAQVEVRADYLFGQPVTRGKVKLVRESRREWNYREQKWDVEEGETYEGSLNAKGIFTVPIDLSKAHEGFESTRWRRYEDRTYAAYITDETTGRTEQKRFDLRLTREAIHIYAIALDENRTPGAPLYFYVSASYADGTPASCEISISERVERDVAAPGLAEYETTLLKKIRTNRYGVARVSGLSLPRREDRDRNLRLSFSAQGDRGASGEHIEDIWQSDDEQEQIRLETDKSLYRAGEPIGVSISSTEKRSSVILSILRGWQLLHSQSVQLRHGRAFVQLPWRPEFKNEVSIAATSFRARTDDYFSSRSVTVLYPKNDELRLNIKLDRDQYRPGDEAQASFRVQTADGRSVASALGVTVMDRAVEERIRTDREFSGQSYGSDYYGWYLGAGDNFGGVTLRDLKKVDLTQPLPEGFDLVAEVLLSRRHYAPRVFAGDEYADDLSEIFGKQLDKQFASVKWALETRYKQSGEYPRDAVALSNMLATGGIRFDELRDPWQMPYRTEFDIVREQDALRIFSAGPDKKFDTDDDFYVRKMKWPYFKFDADKIIRLTNDWISAGGRVTLDAEQYKAAMRERGFDLDALRDRWHRPYRLQLRTQQERWLVTLRSSGPDGKFEPTENYVSGDDFYVFSESFHYFAKPYVIINEALSQNYRQHHSFPETQEDLRAVLGQYGVDAELMRDVWGREYDAVFTRSFRYSDRVVMSYQALANTGKQRTDIQPVTEQINFLTLRSRGEDGQRETKDDFNVGVFSRVVAEQSATEEKPQPVSNGIVHAAYSGAISGVITDASGAVIPNALIRISHKLSAQSYEARSNSEGHYLIGNLPSGMYDLRCEASGFKHFLVIDVLVKSSNLTQVNLTLEVGTVSESVSVMAAAVSLQTESASSVVESRNVASLPLGKAAAQVISKSDVSTPRLRQYFQETLLWQPELETDKQGRALLKFRIADNITTWKMSVIGSTAEGEIGMAEKEFLAFQPFFAEHDPPKILTEGDEISLPVVLRNYLEKSQRVDAEIKPESWFTLLSEGHQRAEVKAGDAGKVIFDFRATASVRDGRQRITASGSDASDAIEKPVSVHPDGEEIITTSSDVFSHHSAMEIQVTPEVIKNSLRGELKIYPNLLSHALESIEGILQRPYGCGEQTISSTYPNVMLLRYLQQRDEKTSALAAKAARYTRAGYERLLRYREADGGFSYWGRGEADPALTAYAVRFLSDARAFTEVDAEVIRRARQWLMTRQQADGRWIAKYWSQSEDTRRSAVLTALISRVMAMDKEAVKEKSIADALNRALSYLEKKSSEMDEPYLIASYALAAMESDDEHRSAQAVSRLQLLAREEAGTTYWNLESNTPFYGWGLAGRVETTALVIKALSVRQQSDVEKKSKGKGQKAKAENEESPAANPDPGEEADGESNRRKQMKNSQFSILNSQLSTNHQLSVMNSAPRTSHSAVSLDALMERGLLFLLRNKDSYGVWHSTQATINVLDALLSLHETDAASDPGGEADIMVNGRKIAAITIPTGKQLVSPLTTDLSAHLIAGVNRVEIRRHGEAARASAQLVETHYIPWKHSTAKSSENTKPRESGGLRLQVSYDKTEAEIGEAINCTVAVERIGSGGYGMLLGEIGLPPGAEVDRASLEKAAQAAGWALNHYDILPDRLIVYLWPQAGGTKFSFAFRQRCGIRAQTASSSLYDYYNPESRVVVAPTRFVVK